MRRPMDFWKGMVLAQALIFVVYMMYGAYVYVSIWILILCQENKILIPVYSGISGAVYPSACFPRCQQTVMADIRYDRFCY